MGEVKRCGICGSAELAALLDMGIQPLAEDFTGSSIRYPLDLRECASCGLVQLGYAVEPGAVFTPGHPYATGNTAFLREHFMRLGLDALHYMKVGDLLVDIGANDGTLLRSLIGHGVRMAGVEPTGQITKFKGSIKPYQEFFTRDLGIRIRMENGPARVITACNVMAHVPDVHDFMEGIASLLAPDGWFVAENHDAASVLEGLQIDTVYHEHLRYYSPGSFARLLDIHGFRMVSCTQIPTHGGSFRVWARKKDDRMFGPRAQQLSIRLHAMVRRAAADGPIYGIGAATRAVPLLHYARLGEYLKCVCEVAGSDKVGHCMPGTFIPVVDEHRLFADQPPHALLFSWHVPSIPAKLWSAGYRGKIIVPLPEPKILEPPYEQ